MAGKKYFIVLFSLTPIQANAQKCDLAIVSVFNFLKYWVPRLFFFLHLSPLVLCPIRHDFHHVKEG